MSKRERIVHKMYDFEIEIREDCGMIIKAGKESIFIGKDGRRLKLLEQSIKELKQKIKEK